MTTAAMLAVSRAAGSTALVDADLPPGRPTGPGQEPGGTGLPDGFRLSVKAPRGLTRARKLYAPEGWLQRIAAAGRVG